MSRNRRRWRGGGVVVLVVAVIAGATAALTAGVTSAVSSQARRHQPGDPGPALHLDPAQTPPSSKTGSTIVGTTNTDSLSAADPTTSLFDVVAVS